jgi:hypothetical protein
LVCSKKNTPTAGPKNVHLGETLFLSTFWKLLAIDCSIIYRLNGDFVEDWQETNVWVTKLIKANLNWLEVKTEVDIAEAETDVPIKDVV